VNQRPTPIFEDRTAVSNTMAPPTSPSERTPLLKRTATSEQDVSDNATGNGVANGHATGANSDVDKPKPSIFTRLFGSSQILAILLSGTLLSFTFSITQTPMLYAFHLIECDIYYETHPPYEGTGDKCSVDWVAAQMAIQMSIIGMCTTFFGTFNLFVAGWSVKRWGPRLALILQLVFSGTRVAIQTVGIYIGGQEGIIIIACSQMVTVLGGPAGYILILNTIAGELVEPMRRTAVFGQLQGCAMIGTASGFLLGGLIGNSFGIRMPFQTAFCMFCVSAIYVRLVLPYISPDSMSGGKERGSGKKGFLAPLRILAPQRIRMPDSAVIRKHYGVVFLCLGIFTSVLATGYAPILVQMYATVAFDFNQTSNGILMSGNFAVRAFFLIFIFPRIIDAGRKWWSSSKSTTPSDAKKQKGNGPTAPTHLPTEPEEFDRPAGLQGEEEPEILQPADDEDRSACQFDLFFLRWSLLLDGFLTTLAAYGTQPWHMFLGKWNSMQS
jgi:hypothetical protein